MEIYISQQIMNAVAATHYCSYSQELHQRREETQSTVEPSSFLHWWRDVQTTSGIRLNVLCQKVLQAETLSRICPKLISPDLTCLQPVGTHKFEKMLTNFTLSFSADVKTFELFFCPIRFIRINKSVYIPIIF